MCDKGPHIGAASPRGREDGDIGQGHRHLRGMGEPERARGEEGRGHPPLHQRDPQPRARHRKRKAGLADRFRGSWYDSPHELNLDMQQEAFAWLDRWLKA